MPPQALRVKGYRETLRAFSRAERATKKEARAALREVGEVVRVEAAQRFRDVDAKTAAGYRTRVRQRGISVEQSLRRTTGTRPDYGELQMREALIPAAEAKEAEITKGMEKALDRIADHFDR